MQVYLAPDAKTDQIDIIFNSLKANIDKTLIIGDFNAQNEKWRKGKINTAGKYIYQKTLEEGLKIRQLKETATPKKDTSQ